MPPAHTSPSFSCNSSAAFAVMIAVTLVSPTARGDLAEQALDADTDDLADELVAAADAAKALA